MKYWIYSLIMLCLQGVLCVFISKELTVLRPKSYTNRNPFLSEWFVESLMNNLFLIFNFQKGDQIVSALTRLTRDHSMRALIQ